MKNSLLVNRKLIWFSIENKLGDIGIGDVSVISEGNPTKIYIICPKKLKKKNTTNLDRFKTFIPYNGECECFIETYENFERGLTTGNKKYISLSSNGTIIFDVKKNYNKIVSSYIKKKNRFSIIKLFYRLYNKLLYFNILLS